MKIVVVGLVLILICSDVDSIETEDTVIRENLSPFQRLIRNLTLNVLSRTSEEPGVLNLARKLKVSIQFYLSHIRRVCELENIDNLFFKLAVSEYCVYSSLLILLPKT